MPKHQTLVELVEKREKDIAPVEIQFCLNLHLLWTFPACPPFPLAFWIPSLFSVGKHWQQTAARDQIQEVAPCLKPDVWQQNVDEEAEREGAGKDNLEQLGERNGAVCPMPMTQAAEGWEYSETELWRRASMCSLDRCDGCPGAEWTLNSPTLYVWKDGEVGGGIYWLAYFQSRGTIQIHKHSHVLPQTELLTGSCPWPFNTAVCGAGQRDHIAWYSLEYTTEVLFSEPTGLFWTGSGEHAQMQTHLPPHWFSEYIFATCQGKNYYQNVLSGHLVSCSGW